MAKKRSKRKSLILTAAACLVLLLLLAAAVYELLLPAGPVFSDRENRMLAESMEMLKNTTSYRVARKISDANIPFKEPLKKLLKSRRS